MSPFIVSSVASVASVASPKRARASLSLASALCVFAACSASPNAASVDPSDAGDSGTSNIGDAAPAAPCTEDVAKRPLGSKCVLSVSGKVLEENGAPIDGKPVSVCGSVCYFGRSDATGAFKVTIGRFIASSRYAISLHGRPEFAGILLRMASGAEGDVVVANALIVPRMPSDGPPLPADGSAGGAITSGEVTLNVPAATSFDLDPEDLNLGAPGRFFRAASVPVTMLPDWAASSKLVLLYGLAPFTATPNPAVKMPIAIANAGGLAAGTAVEFVRLGSQYFGMHPDAGTTVVVGNGHVSADGKSIASDPGEGLDQITWLGVRAKSG